MTTVVSLDGFKTPGVTFGEGWPEWSGRMREALLPYNRAIWDAIVADPGAWQPTDFAVRDAWYECHMRLQFILWTWIADIDPKSIDPTLLRNVGVTLDLRYSSTLGGVFPVLAVEADYRKAPTRGDPLRNIIGPAPWQRLSKSGVAFSLSDFLEPIPAAERGEPK